MKKETKFINADRRRFMRNTTVVSGAVAAGVAISGAQAQTEDLSDNAVIIDSGKHAGYQLTDRVKEYYKKARF